MGEIETMMRKSVRAITEEGIQQYKTTKRGDFVLGHAAMVVLAVTQHYWTIEVEAAMEEAGCDGVKAYLEKMLGQMKELTQLVRTKLTKLQSKTMAALIVMEVHCWDASRTQGASHTYSPPHHSPRSSFLYRCTRATSSRSSSPRPSRGRATSSGCRSCASTGRRARRTSATPTCSCGWCR